MNALLDPTAPDVESAARRILQSDAPGQLMPLFFEMLWRKQGRDATNRPVDHTLDPNCVKIADAVVIQRGRPIQWYFSSVREKGVLLAKQRKNVTAESIVDHFLQKKHLSVSGVCAQFIEQNSGARQGVTSTFIQADKFQVWLSTLPSSRSGILHRFVDPTLSPGCAFNWEVSCMWTPSALDADRVESTKELPNLSVPAELRCDVFRPEVSVTKRLVCSRHMAMVDGCCRAICEHVDAITGGRTRISAMELQFKVGSGDSLVLLYPKRMAFTANDGRTPLELQLPCTLPVRLPMETMNSVVFSGSVARRTPSAASAALGGGVAGASSASMSSFSESPSMGRAGSVGSTTASASGVVLAGVDPTCCLVCKRQPQRGGSKTAATSMLLSHIPLKHVLLSLEVLAEAKKKAVARLGRNSNQQQQSKSITMAAAVRQDPPVPLHVTMLFPDMDEEEYEARRRSWGDEKVPVCSECSTGLADAISK